MQINRLVQLYKEDYDFSDVQPFVFSIEDMAEVEFEEDKDSILACPFQKFSIEVDGYNGLVGSNFNRDGTDAELIARCIIVNEISPNVYDLLVLAEIWVDGEKVNEFVINYPPERNDITGEFRPVIREYLNRLHSSDNGTFVGSGKTKYRFRGNKAVFRPRSVIYVGKKNKQKVTNGGNTIDWSNSWNVMAHWRRLSDPESVGLDRSGNRSAVGYTWISSYVKGDGPISNKVRVVND